MNIILDISNNTERECRICFESTNGDDLISPCLCRGTSKWIHHSCLQTWRENSENDDARVKCMECNYEYNLITVNIPENIEIIRFFITENNEIKHKYTGIYIFFLFYCLISFPIVLEPIELSDNYMSIDMLNFYNQRDKEIFLNYIKRNDFFYMLYFYSLNLNININILYFLLLLNLCFNVKYKKIFFQETFVIFYKNILLTNIVYFFYYIFFYFESLGPYIFSQFMVQILNYHTIKSLFIKMDKVIKKINIEHCQQQILNYVSDDVSDDNSYYSSSSEEIELFANIEDENEILLDENKE